MSALRTVKPSMVPGLEAGTLSIGLTLRRGFSFVRSSLYDGISFPARLLYGQSTWIVVQSVVGPGPPSLTSLRIIFFFFLVTHIIIEYCTEMEGMDLLL